MFWILFSLLINTSSATFPYGRCYVNNCNASPYQLTRTTANCYQVTKKQCTDNSKYKCCDALSRLHKVVFPVKNFCNNAVTNVTVNGVKKGGGVYFETNDGETELRLTNLGITGNASICIYTKEPCSSLDIFFVDSRYSVFDSSAHNCCPVCVSSNQQKTTCYDNDIVSCPFWAAAGHCDLVYKMCRLSCKKWCGCNT